MDKNTLDYIINLNLEEFGFLKFRKILDDLSDEDKSKVIGELLIKEKKDKLNYVVESLSPEIRMKYVQFYDFKKYKSINSFVLGMTNEEDIYNAAKEALNKVDKYNIIDVFSVVPYNKKREFLKLIREKEQESNEKILSSFNIGDYLKVFKLDERLDILKNVLFKDFQTIENEYTNEHFVRTNARFGSETYAAILETFSDEKEPDLFNSKLFECLNFLCDESAKIREGESGKRTPLLYPNKIIEVFYNQGYDQNKVIDYLLDIDGLIASNDLGFIVRYLPLEAQKDTINYLLDSQNKRELTNYEFYNLISKLPLEETTKYYIKYAVRDKRFDYLYTVNRDYLEYTLFDYLTILFENLPSEEVKEYYQEIKNSFAEITKFPEYNEKYNSIIQAFAEMYDLEPDKLNLFIQKFGYNILKHLDAGNIKKYINADDDTIEKLLDLFSDDTIKMGNSVINDVLNSLLQRQFRLECGSTYNIFATFELLYQNNDFDGIKDLLVRLFMDYNYYFILENYNYTFDDLYNEVITGNFNLLHEITSKYIAYEREMFLKENLPEAYEMLQMKRIITRESYKQDMIKNHRYFIAIKCAKLENVNFTEDQRELIDNYSLMNEIINFKQDPKGYKLDNKYKKYLRTLSQLLDILYDNTVDYTTYREGTRTDEDIKFEPTQGDIPKDFLIGVLLQSNYDGVTRTLHDKDNYSVLKKYLEKYKIMGWKDIFTKVMNNADVEFDEEIIGSLISNFDKIKPYIDNNATLTSVLDYSKCYSTVSNFYKILFGTEDYNLIVANSGRNKANMSKYARLSACRDLVNTMYNKDSFNVPTIDKNYSLKSEKNIRVILGNSTNMMNLTYGERTGACMRKGGAFNDLFEHCIISPNGFHIRLVNPETGKFISRVSGTRNGNTIFLNELRFSEDSEYNNEDLYEVIKMVSEDLITLSKDSSMPIDNVIITSEYALTPHKDEEQKLNLTLDEKKETLRGISFNFSDTGILLASSKDDGKIMPYIFTNNLPKYASIRDDVKIYAGEDATNRLMQIRVINDMLNGVPYEDINIEYNGEKPDYVISGEDFYIAIKNENIIETFIMDVRKNDMRTQEEFNTYMNKLGHRKSK